VLFASKNSKVRGFMAKSPNEIKKLMYRSLHRGCKETDIILGNFATAHLAELSDSELTIYEVITELDDALIYAIVTKKMTIPADLDSAVMRKLIEFNS
jgi:antitoxin CptB